MCFGGSEGLWGVPLWCRVPEDCGTVGVVLYSDRVSLHPIHSEVRFYLVCGRTFGGSILSSLRTVSPTLSVIPSIPGMRQSIPPPLLCKIFFANLTPFYMLD